MAIDTPTPAQQLVLRRMRDDCVGFAHLDEERAALDYAIAALEAVAAKDTYIREADRRISELASLLNQSNVDRFREVEALQLALDNEQAKGAHTCNIYCARPLCVMTRRAKAAEARLVDAFDAGFMASDECWNGGHGPSTENKVYIEKRTRELAAILNNATQATNT